MSTKFAPNKLVNVLEKGETVDMYAYYRTASHPLIKGEIDPMRLVNDVINNDVMTKDNATMLNKAQITRPDITTETEC